MVRGGKEEQIKEIEIEITICLVLKVHLHWRAPGPDRSNGNLVYRSDPIASLIISTAKMITAKKRMKGESK